MAVLTVLAGAVLLLWPALANFYPLAFIDTVSYLLHTLSWTHPWDKTAAYGPLMLAAHWRVSLWGVVAAQAALLSWLLWRVQGVVRGEGDGTRHLLLMAILAVASTAPWFASLLMPDILAPVVVLALFLMGWDERAGPGMRAAYGAIAAAAIAAHLSHLGIAGALVVVAVLARRRAARLVQVAAPLGLAVLFLLAANLLAFGKPVLSAHGALFLLARLQADGPAAETLRRHCPQRGWVLCAHADLLPMESDRFLWSGDSPILRDRGGAPRPGNGLSLVGEASEIVATTLREQPLETAQAMIANTLRQALRTGVGDTLDPSDLRGGVADVVADLLGAGERARFQSGAQLRGDLVAPSDWVHACALVVALALIVAWGATGRWRRKPAATAFLACALIGILANAFMTGALSGPHDRYGARIAWLIVAAAAVIWLQPGDRRPCEPDQRYRFY